MADDDKIVIPIEITTEDAKNALDDLASTASSAFDKVASKRVDTSKATSTSGKESASVSSQDDGLSDSAEKLNEASKKLGEAANKTEEAEKHDEHGAESTSVAAHRARYPLPTAEDTPEAATAASVQRSIEAAAKRVHVTPDQFKERHDDLYSDASGSTEDVLRKALHAIVAKPDVSGEKSVALKPGATTSAEDAEADHTKPRGRAESKSPPNLEAAAFGETNAEIGKSAEAVRLFRESLHVLHPALEEAGISLGAMTGFLRASTGGVVALGAALVSTLVVGLAKVSEEADKEKRRLDILTGAGKGGGESQAERVREIADKLNVIPDSIASSAEKLFTFQRTLTSQDRSVTHPPGFVAGENEAAAANVAVHGGGTPPPTNETITTALKAVVEAGRLDRTETSKANKAFTDFFEKITSGKGLVTADAIKELRAASPSLAESVTRGASGTGPGSTGQTFADSFAYEKYIREGGRPQTGGQALSGLARVEPELKTQADKVPVDLSRALEAGEAKVHGFAEALADATLRAAKFLSQTPSEAYKSTSETSPNLGKLLHGDFSNAYSPEPKPSSPEATTKSQEPIISNILPNLEKLLRGDFSNASAPKPSTAPASPALNLDRTAPPPIGFDRDSSGAFIRNEVPIPAQPPAIGPRSEAAPAQPQQFASLESVLSSLAAAISSLGPKQDLKQTGPADAVGIRGDTQTPQDITTATNQVAALGNAAAQATQQLESVKAPEQTTTATKSPPVAASEGGHIRGTGTSTSDSIPAMLSDGEYVVKAEAVKRVGVENLDAVNGGSAHLSAGGEVRHYADGGSAIGNTKKSLADLGGGPHQIDYNRDTGGATIDGIEYPPGSPILNDPEIQRLLQESLKGGEQDKQRTTKSSFVGSYDYNDMANYQGHAVGGLIQFAKRFAEGGLVGSAPSVLQHFNLGGLASRISRSTAPVVGFASGGVARSAPSAVSDSMEHWGTVDLRHESGDFKVATERDTMRHLSANAQRAKRFSTGRKPNWYGAGQ